MSVFTVFHINVIIVFISALQVSYCKIWEIPISEQLQECYNRVDSVSVDSYVGSIYSWHCEHSLINSSSPEEQSQHDPLSVQYINQLYKTVTVHIRSKRQSTNRCVRKEYRMLTSDERSRYHNAINTLKRDTSVRPNKYDALANVHTGINNQIAHGGPGFLGWHRVYLLMYETALREGDPTVCIPYWDSSLDNQLTIPSSSSIWTPEFLGTPQGPVLDGPFANWQLPSGVDLIRNVGVDGELFSTTDITNILSRRRHEEIVTSSTAIPRYDLELQHGSVHVFVGGAMTRLDTAAFDPVFFMHHAFIDYVWERFRQRLRTLGVNPSTYPRVTTNSRHAATAPTGFTGYTQADGYSDTLASRVTYEPVPTCSAASPSCGNRFLVCQTRSGRCLPTVRTTRTKRSVTIPGTCDFPDYAKPIQNDYCSGQTCDTAQWAMIPVKIVNVRPPKFQTYGSFPVSSGHVDKQRDIYSPSAYTHTNKYIASRRSNPMTYEKCGSDTDAGQIFLYSNGINYSGYYKESSIVDQRLAVSVSMGFIGVKKPSPGAVSKALLRAHDSCGRVCRVACKDPVSQEYKTCSGAVALSDDSPHMYGSTYDDAVMNVFGYDTSSDCPKFKTDDFFITFFCDFHNKFPYSSKHSATHHR